MTMTPALPQVSLSTIRRHSCRPFELFCRDFGNAFSRDYIGDADLTTCMLGLDVGGYIEQDPSADRAIFGGLPMFQFHNADGSVRTAARQQLNDRIKRKRILFSYLRRNRTLILIALLLLFARLFT